MELNLRQLEAVQTTEGPVIILAGPGTGKTHTFAHRVVYLLQEKRVLPTTILAVTFTRNAANEMRERLQSLLPQSSGEQTLNDLWVDTYHAVALRLLREQGYPFGLGIALSVVSEQDKPALLEGLIQPKDRQTFLEQLRDKKQRLQPLETNAEIIYQNRLLSRKLLDFDDLFVYVDRLFQERPHLRTHYRQRFHYVAVDEFQDTSFAQYHFLQQLSGENICVIGDPDQAIYGFTSGSFHPFERFAKDYPTHCVRPLSENYRSQAIILEAAKQVIAENRAQLPREIYARLEQGFPIEILPFQTDRQEAEMIVRRIEGLLGGASYFTIDSRWATKEKESYTYGLKDIAILYRFHAQARLIEKALERAGLPYRTYGKKPRENGNPISSLEDLEDYLNHAEAAPSLISPRGEAVSLMTLHRSKGLEFPVVFLAGCEDGVLPYCTSQDPARHFTELEEERRLFYVGMTRAKSRLFLSYARKRFLFGRTYEARPSPFVLDIQEDLRVLQESQAPAKKKPAQDRQLTLFEGGKS